MNSNYIQPANRIIDFGTVENKDNNSTLGSRPNRDLLDFYPPRSQRSDFSNITDSKEGYVR